MAHPKPTPDPASGKSPGAKSGKEPLEEEVDKPLKAPLAEEDLEVQLNTSLNDVLDLLAREIERLKVELEFYRLSQHPDKARLERLYVERIDARQDRLEEIKALILAGGDPLH